MVKGLYSTVWVGAGWVQSDCHQIPEVNYLDRFKIRIIPCRVKAEPLLYKLIGYLETLQIVYLVWLVVGISGEEDPLDFPTHCHPAQSWGA